MSTECIFHRIPCTFLGKCCKKNIYFRAGNIIFLPYFSTQNWLIWFSWNFVKILTPRDTSAQKIFSCMATVWQSSKKLKEGYIWKFFINIKQYTNPVFKTMWRWLLISHGKIAVKKYNFCMPQKWNKSE